MDQPPAAARIPKVEPSTASAPVLSFKTVELKTVQLFMEVEFTAVTTPMLLSAATTSMQI